MMKRRICALVMLCALLLTACGRSGQEPFYFYFPSAENGEAFTARRAPVGDAAQLSVRVLMERYLAFEPTGEARALFDGGCTLDDAYMENNTAVVCLSLPAAPAAHRRTQGYACIARTLLQLDGVLRVRICCGDEEITLSERDLLLTDTGMLPQQDEVTLYYPDRERRYLTPVRQTVAAMTDDELPAYVLEQLLSDTSRSETSCIPDGTFLLGVQVSEDGLCTVNLSAAFRNESAYAGFNEARLAVYSIVNSLTELPGIDAVSLQVSGTPLSALHSMKLPERMTHNRTMLSRRSGDDYLDIDLFFPCERANGLLVGVPYTVSIENSSAVEAAVRALIDFEPAFGLENPIPEGTRILSVKLSGEICVVDLTAEAVLQGTEASQKRMLMSLIATLCALDGVSSVQVLVEGLPPSYTNPDYSGIYVSESRWFAE